MVPFYPFLGEGSPNKIDYRKKGTLILTSLLEDPVVYVQARHQSRSIGRFQLLSESCKGMRRAPIETELPFA